MFFSPTNCLISIIVVCQAVAAALEYMDHTASALFVGKILKEETALKLEAGTKRLQDYDIPGVEMQPFTTKMAAMDATLFQVHALYITKEWLAPPPPSKINPIVKIEKSKERKKNWKFTFSTTKN